MLSISSVLILFVGVVPVPYATVAEGVVWLPETAIVRASHRCDIVEVFVEDGVTVEANTPLLVCEDVELIAEQRALEARTLELVAERTGLSTTDPVRYQLINQDLTDARAALALVEERLAGQHLGSGLAGRFTIDGESMLLGRHIEQGAVIAYVVPSVSRTIRVAVTQDEIGELSAADMVVDVALLEHRQTLDGVPTRIIRRTPGASRTVLSRALVRQGGGRLLAHDDGTGLQLTDPVFDVELDWPAQAPISRVGGAVRVRFHHAARPIGERLTAGIRRAFIGRTAS